MFLHNNIKYYEAGSKQNNYKAIKKEERVKHENKRERNYNEVTRLLLLILLLL